MKNHGYMKMIAALAACASFNVCIVTNAQNNTVYVENYAENESRSSGPGPARLEFFGKLGLIGSGSTEVSNGSTTMDLGDFDLDPSFGAGVGFSYLFLDYVGIGGRVQFSALSVDENVPEDQDGLTTLDIAVVPRGRFPFLDGKAAAYVVVPFGLSVLFREPDDADDVVGFNLGVMPGFEFFVAERFALFAEAGFQYRTFTESGVSAGIEVDLTSSITELSIALGGQLAF